MQRLLSRLSSKIRKMKVAAAAKIRNYVSTAWLRKLFPHTGEPDEFAHRLQRTHAAMIDIDGQEAGLVICQFIYPDLDGSIQAGVVKFFLPLELKERPGRRVPLLHNAGYEIGDEEAVNYLKEGIAVSTVHNHPLNVLSRGPKLEWALMHAMRRLAFVDDGRVMVKGSCTGGNQALLSAVETFPLVCAMPIVPLVNLAYSLSYLGKSQPVATSCRPGSSRPWLPTVAGQQELLTQAAERFGADFEAPAYFELSPVRLVEYVTAPVLAVFCTGDLNVPVDQVDPELTRPYDAADFPDGYTRDMSVLVAHPERRVRLLDVIPAGRREIFSVPVPKDARKKRMGGDDFNGKPLDVPFSRSRQWSIAVIDEGPPEPRHSHFKHYIQPDTTNFRHWADGVGIQEDQLTPGKLAWLMKRYLDVQPLEFMVTPGQAAPYTCRLLDFPQAERADVLRGLITFARSDAAATRLAECYTALPAELKGLGEALGTGSAESVRRALAEASVANEVCRSQIRHEPRVGRGANGNERVPEKLTHFFGQGYHRVYRDYLLPPELTRVEVDFLIRVLRPQRGERWLDMPCGYGRHLAALAESRLELRLVGGDLSRDYLREPGLREVAAVAACDMRRLPFADGSCDVVLNMLNSFGYYPPEKTGAQEDGRAAGIMPPLDDRATLAEFARVLRPGGRLVLDLANRRALIERVQRDPMIRYAGAEYESLERFTWDPETEVMRNETVWRWPGGRERARYHMWLFAPWQIANELKLNGLEVEKIFGGFDGRPFDSGKSERMLVIAKK
ncbi:class I SAM-dependent methyltransferase [bacterium]|nr:class I SAM-dependent methyltransferase [bacterium]